jgi:hypothetical protein
MARKKATLDELKSVPKRMATRGGAHRKEDSRRDGNKHEDKTKKNQDATLSRYVI